MKKVHIIALHLAYGGVEKAITNLANLLAEKCEVEILSVYDLPDAPAYALDERVRVRYLLKDTTNREQWRRSISERDVPAFFRESFRAVKILVGKRLAVIRAIRGIREGVIITTRHEDNLLLSRYGRKGVRKIAQLHHDHGFERKYMRDFARGYGNIDLFVLLTPGLAGEVRQMMGRNRHTEITAIPNFLSELPELPAEREKTLIAVGRMHPVKGFDRLLKAFARVREAHPDWRLEIVGDGTEKEKLLSLIGELGLRESVFLPGAMSGEEALREMQKASLYAMSSHSEGLPFVLIEACACGLPTVAYDVRVGPGSVIRDGENGFLIPDGDEETFCQRLSELMENEEKRALMGQKAREIAREYTKEAVAELWTAAAEL